MRLYSKIPQLVSKLLDGAEITSFWLRIDFTYSFPLEGRYALQKKICAHLKAEPTPADYQFLNLFGVEIYLAKKNKLIAIRGEKK